MRKSTFSESQIVGILREAEGGVPMADLLRNHGISRPTSKYGGATVSDVKRLRELEVENAKLTRMYADLASESAAIKDVLHRKLQGRSRSDRSPRCSSSSTGRDAAVIDALNAVVAVHGRWGLWKLFDGLRAQGQTWNHKRVHRVYCALRLNLPCRTVRRVPKRVRQPLAAPHTLNHSWAMDSMSDTLYGGRRIRALTIIDEGYARRSTSWSRRRCRASA